MKLSNDFGMPDDYKCDGCGSGWSAKFIPNTIYFLSIKEACRIHDYAYEKGKTLEDKEKADREFLNNLLRIIEGFDKWYYPTYFAKQRALKYYEAVVRFGGVAFWDGKHL